MLMEAETQVVEAGLTILRKVEIVSRKTILGATLGAVYSLTPKPCGTKKSLDRKAWEQDRQKRKDAKKARRRNKR